MSSVERGGVISGCIERECVLGAVLRGRAMSDCAI